MTRWAIAIATWFGCGFAPVAPGTVASLAAIALALLAARSGIAAGWMFAVLAVLTTPVAIWAAARAARALGEKDPRQVVVDEVLGQWVALGASPALGWKQVAAAFVLFRLFDIWKPWPVRRLEQLPEGTGIVMDDLAAGVYAAVVLAGVRWFNLI
jgi:phosphatidylglycerophosphatase A